MEISLLNPADTHQVVDLYQRVFSDSENEEEGRLIGDLVANLIAIPDPGDLIGFTAFDGGALVGAILFSRFEVPGNALAYILSPVAIATNMQRKGVGQALINYGLDYLRGHKVKLAFTYGDPAYYSQVGFSQISESVVKAPLTLSQPQGWLAQSLDGDEIQPMVGDTKCVGPLSNQVYW